MVWSVQVRAFSGRAACIVVYYMMRHGANDSNPATGNAQKDIFSASTPSSSRGARGWSRRSGAAEGGVETR